MQRGQVTFPSEASLACGLNFLQKQCIKTQKGTQKYEIVRLKNLFRTSGKGLPEISHLPTGYRHMLLSIRIDGGLIAGKSLCERLSLV